MEVKYHSNRGNKSLSGVSEVTSARPSGYRFDRYSGDPRGDETITEFEVAAESSEVSAVIEHDEGRRESRNSLTGILVTEDTIVLESETTVEELSGADIVYVRDEPKVMKLFDAPDPRSLWEEYNECPLCGGYELVERDTSEVMFTVECGEKESESEITDEKREVECQKCGEDLNSLA